MRCKHAAFQIATKMVLITKRKRGPVVDRALEVCVRCAVCGQLFGYEGGVMTRVPVREAAA